MEDSILSLIIFLLITLAGVVSSVKSARRKAGTNKHQGSADTVDFDTFTTEVSDYRYGRNDEGREHYAATNEDSTNGLTERYDNSAYVRAERSLSNDGMSSPAQQPRSRHAVGVCATKNATNDILPNNDSDAEPFDFDLREAVIYSEILRPKFDD